MDEIYYKTYSRLYGARRFGPLLPSLQEGFRFDWFTRGNVRGIIDEAENIFSTKTNLQVRPDAKLFLLINLWEMVAVPIQVARRRESAEIGQIILDDTLSLLNDAAGYVGGGKEISGHALLDALARNWKRLRLSELRLWED